MHLKAPHRRFPRPFRRNRNTLPSNTSEFAGSSQANESEPWSRSDQKPLGRDVSVSYPVHSLCKVQRRVFALRLHGVESPEEVRCQRCVMVCGTVAPGCGFEGIQSLCVRALSLGVSASDSITQAGTASICQSPGPNPCNTCPTKKNMLDYCSQGIFQGFKLPGRRPRRPAADGWHSMSIFDQRHRSLRCRDYNLCHSRLGFGFEGRRDCFQTFSLLHFR